MSATSVHQLADRATAILNTENRILITLAGIPGSGKSTIAAQAAHELNKRGIRTEVVGMDGFHYTRVDLVKLIGEEKAIKFRGAPYTFDAPGVLELAKRLKCGGSDIEFPTFDHAIKDPITNGGTVSSGVKVVIMEGLYLHLKDAEWAEIAKIADDTWFVDVDRDVARERLAKRHLNSGIVSTLVEGEVRADSNDLPNGDYIKANSIVASFIVDANEN